MKRPSSDRIGCTLTTPKAEELISLLGAGASHKGCIFTRDEFRSLQKVYEITDEEDPLMHAGATSNLFKHATDDGIRMVAWLSKYLPAGQDPLRTLIEMAIELGFEVDPEDVKYAELQADGS